MPMAVIVEVTIAKALTTAVALLSPLLLVLLVLLVRPAVARRVGFVCALRIDLGISPRPIDGIPVTHIAMLLITWRAVMPQWVVVVMPLRLVIRAIVATPWLRVFTPPRLLALIPSPWLLLPRRLRSPPGLLIHRSAFAASLRMAGTYFLRPFSSYVPAQTCRPVARPSRSTLTHPTPTHHPHPSFCHSLQAVNAEVSQLSCAKANRIFF